MPECDPTGAISMCYISNVDCPLFHEKVINDQTCESINQQCCRSTCKGKGTFCIPDIDKCPNGYQILQGNDVKCPLPQYICCGKK